MKKKIRKKKCKIENVNNFSLRLKKEMIIFIISLIKSIILVFIIFHQMYYPKSIKITSNNFLA